MSLRNVLTVTCTTSLLLSHSTQAQADLAVERLAWLAGCWEASSGTTIIEEQWTSPRGGAMLGAGRTLRDGKLVAYEFLIVELRDSTVTLVAHPSGQATTPFPAQAISDHAALFANPTHDFPQRIGYERRSADSLLTWIEGSIGGEMQRSEFRYARVPCPGP